MGTMHESRQQWLQFARKSQHGTVRLCLDVFRLARFECHWPNFSMTTRDGSSPDLHLVQPQFGDALTISQRISHDLRSPAGAIATLAALLADEFPERRPVLNSILSCSNEILSIVDQTALVLRATYSPRPEPEAIAVGATVSMVMEKVQLAPRATPVQVTAPQDWPEILGIAEWFHRVWLVLLSNAWKHAQGRVELGWRKQEDQWEFWVRDDGPGLPPGRAENPVPAFETLHSALEIKGLNLPLARRLVQLMNGRLSYQRLSEGLTEFAFTVPAGSPAMRGDLPIRLSGVENLGM